MKNCLIAQSLALVFSIATPLATLPAQGSGPEAANQAAYNIFLSGDYEAAADAYAKVLADYPTSTIVPAAQFQLAFSNYFLGRQDEALEVLGKFLGGPTPPPALLEAARALEPQIYSAKALALPPGDAARNTAFEEAIKKFTAFIDAFPQYPDLEQMVYGRALANFQIGEYDAAIADLEQAVQRYANSPTVASSQNLLALALASKASIEMNKGDEADREAAFKLYDQSISLLRQILESRSDLTLLNDATFQLGEILFNKAAFSPEDQRAALYAEALDAYRSILPKEEIVALQTARIESFPQRRAAALAARANQETLEQLNKENERELRRLAELQGRPDPTSNAMLKMSEIFLNQNQANASRTLLNHLRQFLEAEDQKKRAMYLTAMTYAVQNAADKAVAAYDAFQAEFKGDPLAGNLPFAIGSMFLNHPDPTINNPERAAQYFAESLEIYPDGRLASLTAINRAAALSRLGNAAEAEKTFTDFLATNPPKIEAVAAQIGLANLYRDTGRADEAIAAYQVVVEKFADQPQIADAKFSIPLVQQQKGEIQLASEGYAAFLEEFPEHPMVPGALYGLAQTQVASGDTETGIATYQDLAERFPDSQAATFSYFQRGQILSRAGDTDGLIAIMREFIEKYPSDPNVFIAFDSIGQAALSKGEPNLAVETYEKFANSYVDSPKAAEALLKIADIRIGRAEMLGRYAAMPQEDREVWKAHLDAVIASTEKIFRTYPSTPQVAQALRRLLSAQRLLVAADLMSPDELREYLNGLAQEAPNDSARSKALFTLASYLAENDPAAALETMREAYNPEVVFNPTDLDIYVLALIDDGDVDTASAVLDKLAADYPIPPNTEPNAAPVPVQEAQATLLFGRGRVAQERDDTAAAADFFEQLKTLYPWSPKVLEANFGIAEALAEQQKYDEALALLTQIIRATTAPAELRAESMLLGGDIMIAQDKLEPAIDYYLKIAQFYGGVPGPAATGLWKGAQLLERQAAGMPDGPEKTRQLDIAKRSYKDLVDQYPNSEYAPQAAERLSALEQ